MVAEDAQRAQAGWLPCLSESAECIDGRGFVAGFIHVIAGEEDEVGGGCGDGAEQSLETVGGVRNAADMQIREMKDAKTIEAEPGSETAGGHARVRQFEGLDRLGGNRGSEGRGLHGVVVRRGGRG